MEQSFKLAGVVCTQEVIMLLPLCSHLSVEYRHTSSYLSVMQEPEVLDALLEFGVLRTLL